MTVRTWPTGRHWLPADLSFGASTPKSAFVGFFTGNVQSVGHLSDRLRCTLSLPPCGPAIAQQREAWILSLLSTGDFVRLQHFQRSTPLGTMRGTPTVGLAALAGARTIRIQTTAAATLVAGDMLGIGTQLLMVDYAGATANGSGVMDVPLVLPLVQAVAVSDAVTWSAPTGQFQMVADSLMLSYLGRRNQARLELSFIQRP